MAYLLRFVQRIDQAHKKEFVEIEKQFIRFEREQGMPIGRRYMPTSGMQPSNTMVWECEFETLEALIRNLGDIYSHPEHERLLAQQVPFMLDSYTEIYEMLSEE